MEFVNFEDAKNRLGKTDDELQGMIKSGEIRAFRDEGTWKFRKEDIDARAGATPPEGPETTPAPAAGPEQSIELGEDAFEEDAGDTLMSIDADILFAEEEDVPADSAAETWIAADTEGVFPGGRPGEEVPRGVEEAMAAPETEPAPLALSPETDESSLQEVLSDEDLAAGEDVFAEEPVIAVDTESGLASVMSSSASGTAVAPSRTRVVTLVEAASHHGSFTVLMGLAVVALGFAVTTIMALLQNNRLSTAYSLGTEQNSLYLLLVGAFMVGVVTVVGIVIEKQRQRREALGGV